MNARVTKTNGKTEIALSEEAAGAGKIEALVADADVVNLHFPGVAGHHGENLKIKQAIKSLQAREAYLGEVTKLRETFQAMPWDGAYALDKVMTGMFGWTEQQTVKSWFGDTPPQLVKIEIAPGIFSDVPWGRIGIPKSSDGYMDLSASMGRDGMVKFEIVAQVLRKDEPIVSRIFKAVREELMAASIYRGKAIKVRFTDEDGDPIPLPMPDFLDTSKVRVEQLILSDDVMMAVNTSLFVPIQRVDDTLANGMRVKRGVLLGGTYGTGKSLIASVASRHATDNGVTFVYVDKAADLGRAIAFCKQYQTPKSAAVIFCEDVDRVTDGKRDASLDELLNIFDGIDSKQWNIIVVMTTNHMESINAAMIRPGRLDACIDIPPPDARAVERLIRHYGGDTIDLEMPLGEVGVVLAGNIPAVIEEVVKRAKLAQLAFEPRGARISQISEQALIQSAKTMAMQIELLRKAQMPQPKPPTLDSALADIVQRKLDDLEVNIVRKVEKVIEDN